MNFMQRKKNQQPNDAKLNENEEESAPQKPVAQPEPKAVEEKKPEYKFGIAQRLDDATETQQIWKGPKRSPDLVELSKKYDAMRKGVRQMIISARKYHATFEELDSARLKFSTELSAFADGSPIEKNVTSTATKKSFISVYKKASEDTTISSEKFQTSILDYCDEWETVICTRVDTQTEEVKKLRTTYNHYQSKVDALRKKVKAQEAKGQEVQESVAEKLQRNEEKLDEASAAFEAAAAPLCALIEEVVESGWKDVFPMIQATMKWELQRTQREAEAFGIWQPRNLEDAAPGLSKYQPPASPDMTGKSKKPKKGTPEAPVS